MGEDERESGLDRVRVSCRRMRRMMKVGIVCGSEVESRTGVS